MKNIKFTKMHGLGNDFIVIDGIHQNFQLSTAQIAFMAKRDRGIGFDQCLIVEPSHSKDIDFNYRIFNADGQEVGQCGNGARCIALFIQHYKLSNKKHLKVSTKTRNLELHIHPDKRVTVNMGVPKLTPKDIPFLTKQTSANYSIQLNNEDVVNLHLINVGNPHAVIVVPDIKSAPVACLGQQISTHQQFPEQTNVGFMQIIDNNHIKLRVYERGCGETEACGSGAAAAAALGRLHYNLSEQVTVTLPGGDLLVTWPEINEPLLLTGPAAFVYEGEFFVSTLTK